MTRPPNVIRPAVTLGAELAVAGDADILQAAFEANEQITLDGKFTGERVYLGYRHQKYNLVADAVRLETTGLDKMIGEHEKFPGHTIAAYCIDTNRLDDAPKLAAAVARARGACLRSSLASDARAQAEEDRLSREDD